MGNNFKNISLAILDKRLNIKTPGFIGVFRGLYGIPTPIVIEGQESLSNYLSRLVTTAFNKSNVKINIINTLPNMSHEQVIDALTRRSAKKSIFITLNDWRFEHSLVYDNSWCQSTVLILDENGNKEAEKTFKGSYNIPSSFSLGNEVLLIHKQCLEKIFSDQEIIRALSSTIDTDLGLTSQ